MNLLDIINSVFGILFILCYTFQLIYLFIPFVKKLPPHKETKLHKYAVLICARNEENVIGDLIDSIAAQDYPAELVKVVLVADNCTDRTAEVGREKGAVVYERFNKTEVGKGYALDYGLHKLDEDFGEDAFDAFIVFDADNLLKSDFITEINKTFSDGYEVITTYRNAKNYGDSWLAGGSGLWFIREAKYLNGSRMRIGACPQVSGTGFLFSNSIKKENGGWPYHTLTEDYEFTCDSVVKGKKFGYCEQARFYDDQVTGFMQSWHQKKRWVKGGLQAFVKYWRGLVGGIFSRKFWACYDMTMSFAPAFLIALSAVLVNIVGAIVLIATGGGVLDTLIPMAKMVLGAYLILFLQSAVCTATEWKHIHAHPFKKILYAFTFPLFIFSFIPCCFAALFSKVEWKPIQHKAADGEKISLTKETAADEQEQKNEAISEIDAKENN